MIRPKRLIKRLLAALNRPDRAADVALVYHSVGADSHASLRADSFRSQVDYLRERFRFARASELSGKGSLTATRMAALTFDDGFSDCYKCAFPYLLERGIPFTVFVTTGFVDCTVDFGWSPHYGNLRPLSWTQIKELHRHGVEIGAHTVTHPRLSACSAEAIREELERSKDRLEDVLGSRVLSMAYPFGQPHDVSEAVLRLVEEIGYDKAFTTFPDVIRASSSRFLMPRITADSDDELVDVRQKVDGQRSYMRAVAETRSRLARIGVVRSTSSFREQAQL